MYGNTAAAVLAQVVKFNQDTRLLRVHSPLQPEPFLVHRLYGHEALSQSFAFTVELFSTDAMLELKQLVGQPLRVSMPTPDGDRHFHGYVKEFTRAGTDGGLATYRAEIAPWFAFLDFTSNCRIFQDLNVPDIVAEVFGAYPELAQYRTELTAGGYPPLPYCVQYNESDFAFVSRLLEDAGIHYRFEHAEDGHVMVLADDSTQSKPVGTHAEVRFQSGQAVQSEDGLDRWSARRRVGANARALKSFDFKQPRSALAVQRLMDQPHGVLPLFENYQYDGAARYADSRIGDALAGVRAEESAWQTKLFEGEGAYRSLFVGRYFVLDDHYDHREVDEQPRQFFMLEVTHDARNNFKSDFSDAEGSVYRAGVVCLRRAVPYRPLRQTPHPRMPGPQTATVAGPAGEEIWADRYGRVKVQFHWDRLGQFNEQSSCWVRVASPWAGSGMGGVSAPRIGQEVVIDFLDGNPDRPIITGRVYNEDNMPPFEKEVSGIRSKTVHGDGFNEVTMHDGAGSELLNMHAQRDMAVTVLNDHNSTVKNNKSTSVDANHSLTVGANQSLTIKANRDSSITGNDTLTTQGEHKHTVTGAVAQTFQAGQTLTIPAVGYAETITGPYTTTLTGDYTSQRTGTWNETVTGTSTRLITGTSSHTVNGAVTENLHGGRITGIVGNESKQVQGNVKDVNVGNRKVTVEGELDHAVSATHSSYAGSDMTLASGSKVVLGVGEGSAIVIEGSSITIVSGGSQIKIDSEGVRVNGSKVNLNC